MIPRTLYTASERRPLNCSSCDTVCAFEFPVAKTSGDSITHSVIPKSLCFMRNSSSKIAFLSINASIPSIPFLILGTTCVILRISGSLSSSYSTIDIPIHAVEISRPRTTCFSGCCFSVSLLLMLIRVKK